MRTQNTNLLQVRLTEAEKRHIKTLAVSRGLTLREATLQAFQAWESQLQSRAQPGPRAGAAAGNPTQPDRTEQLRQERHAGEGKSSPAPERGSRHTATAKQLLRRAAQVDWSKCPEAEKMPGKTGNVWVVRGTRAPLAEIFQSVADGHPFMEIADVFEISLQQLIAVMQFAAIGPLAAASH